MGVVRPPSGTAAIHPPRKAPFVIPPRQPAVMLGPEVVGRLNLTCPMPLSLHHCLLCFPLKSASCQEQRNHVLTRQAPNREC